MSANQPYNAQKPNIRNQSGVVWLTGLSGSGKTTIAKELQKKLYAAGVAAFIFDGDKLRSGLNSDLGFSQKDRRESARRVGEVAALFAESGGIAIVALISPYSSDRMLARLAAKDYKFVEVWIKADLSECEKRDPKGVYCQARAGNIKNFTGISDTYEAPENADIVLDSMSESIGESVDRLEKYVNKHFQISE